jgi:hypothetical protein
LTAASASVESWPVTEGDPTEPQRFGFRFQKQYVPMLAALGVTSATAHVMVTEDRLVARFGPWLCSTSLGNVVDVCPTGPYSAVKAIGARLSMTDRGLTFGTTTEGGVCLTFDQPVTGLDPLGVLRHPGLTVTVDDVEGFVTAVRERAGLVA